MRVVVRKIELVYFRAREDKQIGQRHGYVGCPTAIGESDSALPDIGGNLVFRQQLLILPESLPLGVIRDATP